MTQWKSNTELRIRIRYGPPSNPGIPVLIRTVGYTGKSADVTLFPGEAHEQKIGAFDLTDWVPVETTLDKLTAAEVGTHVKFGTYGSEVVKVGRNSWVLIGPAVKIDTAITHTDEAISRERLVKFLDN